MLTLFQAEWCPYSHRVRQRLTELGVDVVLKQVEPTRGEREELKRIAGTDSIPVLLDDDGNVVGPDTESAMAWLDANVAESPHADAHREQAVAHGVP